MGRSNADDLNLPLPVTSSDIPNLITVLRILLVPPFLFAVHDGRYAMALLLFFMAGLSDGLDGFLAKHYRWTSRLGSILDPLADKLLLVAAFLSLTRAELIPFWLTIVVLGRDVLIIVGAIIYHYWIGSYHLTPALLSKVNTFVQISLVMMVIISAESNGVYPGIWIIRSLIYLTLMTTVLSGIQYIILWGRRAVIARRTIATTNEYS